MPAHSPAPALPATPRGPSVRRRLLAGVIITVCVSWLLVAVSSYLEARHELEELLDAHLAQSASLLAGQLAHEPQVIALEHAPELAPSNQRAVFQVWEHGQYLTLHSPAAPDVPLASQTPGLSNSLVHGVRWRVFSTWSRDHHWLIQVAEKSEARDAVSWEIAYHLILPLLITLPVVGVVLSMIIRRNLSPLDRLAQAVGARKADHLAPLDLHVVPEEVAPLVDQLNTLFVRVSRLMDNERRFTADAAHELRTPIAAIRVHAEAARSQLPASPALSDVIAGCDRAARLIDQLLTLARVDGSRERPDMPCDLAPIARQVIGEQADSAYARGISLALDVADDLPAIAGDPVLLHILLRNLLDNACRYSPPDTEVCVKLGHDHTGILLSVSDQGPGIPSEERERVLQRFYRLPGTQASGSGLGLSIVARIAAQHHARLQLSPTSTDHGLTVTITFPARSQIRKNG